MIALPVHELNDLTSLSLALHQALRLLKRSPLHFTSLHLCRLFEMHRSELARMRWFHARPEYAPRVSKLRLQRLLAYLQEQFPTLVIGRSARTGAVTVRLYKYYRGKRLRRTLRRIRPPRQLLRRPYAPGTTRWFLQHEAV